MPPGRADERAAGALPAARQIDVCNGDADGLCAVVQWQLHRQTAPALLVTGLKREIELLERVQAGAGDTVNVFDLSLQRNRSALLRLLDAGVRVRYFDHHAADDIPHHRLLEAHIDRATDVCTSLIVDRALGGALRGWALVGAYGDNLAGVADRLGAVAGIDGADRSRLRRLGEAINYNAYGEDEADVHIAPARLHDILVRYRDPLELLRHESVADEIDAVRRDDLARALAWPTLWQDDGASVQVLPDAAWSRRVLGSAANQLANAAPRRAHAVLVPQRGGYAVSVRAPLATPSGADAFCRRYGGGGRARAAGIDRLQPADLDRFVADFAAFGWSGDAGPA
jgi:hypothetical protein